MKYLGGIILAGLLLSSCGEDDKTEGDDAASSKNKTTTVKDTNQVVENDTLTIEKDIDIEEVEFGIYFEDWLMLETYDRLIEEFGEDKVSLDSTWEYEGTELKLSSTVKTGTGRVVRYVWRDEYKNRYERVEASVTRYDDELEKVVWNDEMKTLAGVHTKMSLKELEKLNGAPITFAGFGWDNGGVITSFNDGKLANAPYFTTLAPVSYLDNQHPPVDDKYVGDVLFSTDKNPEVLEEDIVVHGYYYQKMD